MARSVSEMERPFHLLAPVRTERLLLRPLGMGEVEEFYEMTNEPAIIAAVSFLAHPFTLADAMRLLDTGEDGTDCFWGVRRQSDLGLVGTIGTHLRREAEIELGYWFTARVRGQGLATEAVGALASKMSQAYPGRQLFAECRPENRSSWRLLERLNFQHLGVDGERSGRKRLVFTRELHRAS